jgi:hypothetical protein
MQAVNKELHNYNCANDLSPTARRRNSRPIFTAQIRSCSCGIVSGGDDDDNDDDDDPRINVVFLPLQERKTKTPTKEREEEKPKKETDRNKTSLSQTPNFQELRNKIRIRNIWLVAKQIVTETKRDRRGKTKSQQIFFKTTKPV